MKRIALLTIALITNSVFAECYMRSNIVLKKQQIEGQPTDIQQMVVPDTKGQKCILKYRLQVNKEWQTVEGIGYGKTEQESCANAIDISRGSILADVAPKTVKADNQMVCSDLPDIRVHPVRIGDVVWESETDMHPLQEERKYFWYKKTQCRMFVERNVGDRNLFLFQGIMCRLNATNRSKWQIVDKY